MMGGEMMGIIILIAILCGVCSSVIAAGKGRSGAAWFPIGFLLGFLGVFAAYVSSDESTNYRSQLAPSSSGESASADKVETSKKDRLEKEDLKKLESLAKLRERGALTEEEFQQEKQRVMNGVQEGKGRGNADAEASGYSMSGKSD